MNEQKYIDGYVNQLTENILGLLNPNLVEKYKELLKKKNEPSLFNTEIQELKDIIGMEFREMGIIQFLEGDSGLPIMMEPSQRIIDALGKKRIYQTKKINDEYMEEKKNFVDGKKSDTMFTPYCYMDMELKKGEKTKDELILEADQKFEDWFAKSKRKRGQKIDDRVYLCDYPFYGFYPENRKTLWLNIDLRDNILFLIKEKDIISYAEFKPLSSSKSGMYRPNGKITNEGMSYDINEVNAGEYMATFVEHLPTGKGVLQSSSPFVLDERCSRLINHLTTLCIRNFYLNNQKNGVKSMEVTASVSDMVRITYPETKRPSHDHFERTKLYILNCSYIALMKKKENGQVERKPIFSQVSINMNSDIPDEESYFKVVLGDPFMKDILNNSVATIIKTDVNRLGDNLARLLYQDIKQDRIYDLMNDVEYHNYTLADMQRIAKTTGRQSIRAKKYKDALTELIANEILVKSYECNDYIFEIKWIPFSDVELQDVIKIDTTKVSLSTVVDA